MSVKMENRKAAVKAAETSTSRRGGPMLFRWLLRGVEKDSNQHFWTLRQSLSLLAISGFSADRLFNMAAMRARNKIRAPRRVCFRIILVLHIHTLLLTTYLGLCFCENRRLRF